MKHSLIGKYVYLCEHLLRKGELVALSGSAVLVKAKVGTNHYLVQLCSKAALQTLVSVDDLADCRPSVFDSFIELQQHFKRVKP